MLNELVVGLSFGTALFIFIGMLLSIRLKKFESAGASKLLNMVVIGLLLYFMLVIIDLLNYLNVLDGQFSGIIPLLNTAASVFIVPLFVAMLVAAVLILRDSSN